AIPRDRHRRSALAATGDDRAQRPPHGATGIHRPPAYRWLQRPGGPRARGPAGRTARACGRIHKGTATMSDSTNSANPANGRANGATNGNGASAAGTERQFGVRRLYIRDVSFESPNAPDIFMGNPGEPEIKLNLRTSHKDLGDGNTEVSLHVSAHA